MKKLVLILSFVLFSSSVFAGSCPMMAKTIDAKIAEAQELRDAGMKAHDSGCLLYTSPSPRDDR